ncbi:hypothetical protein N473_18015 [Pseudoalteromonas luteoviolacea CPMOR-1]|uniref:Uncharacterized protein n=1 Tax=Pseudoalteromonas luteoviolacea CPMOR-1 TaxID=1365248 RepID=A0A167KHM6_9GAMM|nr:hypothetical protein [Pseudoalteromonas luteoviolacea]KZN62810.1 hypothetical protein N473_18015 [Pseudoalteromonas luteoviolacea CPMOR-1]
MTRKIDFTTYSLDELYLSAKAVDREQYPKIAKEIDRLILEKEKLESATQNKQLSAIYNKAIFRIFSMFFVLPPAIFSSSLLFDETVQLIITPVFVVVFGFAFFKLAYWNVSDAVYDEGDALLFIKNNKQQRVELKDIVKVKHVMTNRGLIRVQIRNNDATESELLFEPQMKSSISALVSELNRRAISAKRTK